MNKKGFTLVELLIVISILSALSVVGIVAYSGISKKAAVGKIVSDMDAIYKSAQVFNSINGNYPSDVGPGTDPGFVNAKTLTEWPVSPCAPDVVYDWDNWGSWYNDPAFPIVRVSIRRKIDDTGADDDTTLFYMCLQQNKLGTCTCETVGLPPSYYTGGTVGPGYCRGYNSVNAQTLANLNCDDLKSTTKYPGYSP